MKTAIWIPEAVLNKAEWLARCTSRTRSELYSQAIAEYLARHLPNAVTEAMNAVSDRFGNDTDGFASAAAKSTLKKETWDSNIR
jgi:hypothetical protein